MTMLRRRPLMFWVRSIHRWISLAFVTLAAILLIGVAPLGTPLGDGLSALAIVALVLLMITGLWVAIHHYTVGFRRRRGSRGGSVAVGAMTE